MPYLQEASGSSGTAQGCCPSFVTSLTSCNAVLRLTTHVRAHVLQVIAAIISAAVPVDGGRGWTSFGLLLFELNLIVWAGGTPCSISAILPPQKVHMCILTKCRTVPSISSLLNAKMCCASAGYYSDRNAGNAIKELEVRCALPQFSCPAANSQSAICAAHASVHACWTHARCTPSGGAGLALHSWNSMTPMTPESAGSLLLIYANAACAGAVGADRSGQARWQVGGAAGEGAGAGGHCGAQGRRRDPR